MYGMVNEGVRTFVCANFGDDAWQSIVDAAAIDAASFDRLKCYDDTVTYALVSEVAKHAHVSEEEALKVFGTYWVDYAGKSGFGNLLKLAGNSFVERVRNLDDMHDRIQMTMPGLRPPSFELVEVSENAFDLSYYSSRPGLAPMVVGLLHGLAADTGEAISVEQTHARASQDEADVFRIILQK